jgi:hypothetical protein
VTRLSVPQIQALEDVERSGNPWARVHGQAQHGGWSALMRFLEHKQKWIVFRRNRYQLTAAGKAALARERTQ